MDHVGDPEFKELIEYATLSDFVASFSLLTAAQLEAFFSSATPTADHIAETPHNANAESIHGLTTTTRPEVSDPQDDSSTAAVILEQSHYCLSNTTFAD